MDEKRKTPCSEQDFYQTGSTQPPKSHSSIITLLLILVILLTGLVSLLGLQNLRLFQALKESDLSSLSDGTKSSSVTTSGYGTGQPGLGIRGEEVTTLSQHYYEIPAGVYITEITESAQAQGVRTGDILLDVNGSRVTTPAELTQTLSVCRIGDTATVTVYRDGKQLCLSLKVEVIVP